MATDRETRSLRRPFASGLGCALVAAVALLVVPLQPPAGAARAKDRDRDGLSDRYEVKRSRTNPRKKDTDHDRLGDGWEVKRSRTNPRKKDTDHDGLIDGKEVRTFRTSPRRKDTDGDGLADGKEVRRYKTSPLLKDTDGDGLTDGKEVRKPRTDPRTRDTDGDGASDAVELVLGTDPRRRPASAPTAKPALVPAVATPPVRAPVPPAAPVVKTPPVPAPVPTPAPVIKTPPVPAPVPTPAPVVKTPPVPAPVPTPVPAPAPPPVITPPAVQPPTRATPPSLATCTLAPQVSGCEKPFPDQTKMQLVFSDEFNYAGAPDPTKWSPYDGPGHANYGLRCPEAFNVAGGSLTITAQMQRKRTCGATDPSAPLKPVSGGMRARGEWQYTRVVARVRVDPDPSGATSGVMIMWPQDCGFNPTHACGEMDYWETGLDPDRTPVKAFMHYGYDRQKDEQRRYELTQADGSDAGTARDPLNGTQWHEVVADWWPDLGGLAGLYIDGKPVMGARDDLDCSDGDCNWITAIPKHPTIQLDLFKTAMGGPIRMQVDYIRLYQQR